MHSRPLTACYSHSMSQARGYIEGPDFEESVDGLTLLQSHIDCPDKCLYRLEFINARFLYAVRVDTSHVQVAAKINNCPADSCQVQHGATQSPPSATAGESSGGGGGVMSVDDFDAAVAAAAGGSVVLQFTAPWCEACRRAKPLVAQLAAQFADIAFLEVPDGADELVDRFGVSKLPMYIVQRSAAAGRESSGSGSWESASTVSQLAEKLAAVVPAAAQKRKAPADNCPAESPKRPRAAAAGGDGDATAAPTQSTAPLVGNCPLTASAAKFQLAKGFGEKHAVLVSQLERWLQSNGCSISGIEVIFDANQKPYVIDCNTCNTNYNRAAEAAASVPLMGSKAIAQYLQNELGAVMQVVE